MCLRTEDISGRSRSGCKIKSVFLDNENNGACLESREIMNMIKIKFLKSSVMSVFESLSGELNVNPHLPSHNVWRDGMYPDLASPYTLRSGPGAESKLLLF